jgi:histidyl-tRNA synthetase
MNPIRAVKGMNDVLPAEIAGWHRVERAYARRMDLAGFREVRTPYVEPTPLFVRTIGETTDVVEKEMYSFRHRDDDLTLRPEGTAGAARAYVEHKVHDTEPVSRWYYSGPMFRAERPQKGRYRQFYQVGAEIFGDLGPACDAELIDTLVSFFTDIGVTDVDVLVNSLGGPETRARYKAALVAFFEPKRAELSEESQRRLTANPLRILDSKSPKDIAAREGAPAITDVLEGEDLAHFVGLKAYLDALGVRYRVDPTLVRGLDYYQRTLFEIKGARDILGAGDTLCGGGRYDGMIAELGGPKVPAIGFAAGMERLLLVSQAMDAAPVVDVYVAPLAERGDAGGTGAQVAITGAALALGRELRDAGVRTDVDGRGASLKAQLRRANALGARRMLILGDRELGENVVEVKDLAARTQERVARGLVVAKLAGELGAGR